MLAENGLVKGSTAADRLLALLVGAGAVATAAMKLGTIPGYVTGLLLVVFFTFGARTPSPPYFRRGVVPLVLLAAAFNLFVAVTAHAAGDGLRTKLLLLTMPAPFLPAVLRQRQPNRDRVAYVLVGAIAFATLVVVVQWLTNDALALNFGRSANTYASILVDSRLYGTGPLRPPGPFVRSNYAAAAAVVLCATLLLGWASRLSTKLTVTVLVLVTLCVVTTRSREGMIGLLAVLLLAGLVQLATRTGSKRRLALATLLSIAAFAVVPALVSRLSGLGGGQLADINGRTLRWQAALDASIHHNPLFGSYSDQLPGGYSTHNLFLYLWYDYGLVALVVFVALLVCAFVVVPKTRLRGGLNLLVLVIATAGVEVAADPVGALVLWLSIAAMAGQQSLLDERPVLGTALASSPVIVRSRPLAVRPRTRGNSPREPAGVGR